MNINNDYIKKRDGLNKQQKERKKKKTFLTMLFVSLFLLAFFL